MALRSILAALQRRNHQFKISCLTDYLRRREACAQFIHARSVVERLAQVVQLEVGVGGECV